MSHAASKEYEKLLDQVEEFGWRVEKIDSTRWRVFPPKPNPIIHISDSGDQHAFKNSLAALRRAGFDPDRKEPKVNHRTVNEAPPRLPPPPIVAQAQPQPTPVQTIRLEIDAIMNSLSKISEMIDKVEEEEQGMVQLKVLLRTVMK